MKKEYRTYKSQVRQSQYATGGGPAADIDSYPYLDDMDELILLSAEGLFNAHDSDRVVGKKGPTQEFDMESTNSTDVDLELGTVTKLKCNPVLTKYIHSIYSNRNQSFSFTGAKHFPLRTGGVNRESTDRLGFRRN
jgi:hypothetical protein